MALKVFFDFNLWYLKNIYYVKIVQDLYLVLSINMSINNIIRININNI